MKFTKMHGIGNDYVYVNCFEETVKDPAAVAKFVSDRHFGIGSDGLILIRPSEIADCEMDMYNLDGSQGAMCGNGIRCVAKYVYDHGIVDKTSLSIATRSGIKYVDLTIRDGKASMVKVNMGSPILTAKEIPVVAETEQVIDAPITVDGKEYHMTAVSMGGWFDFDVVVATPDMMGVVGRLGKVLGPKGLMPSPKAGTVTMDVTKAVNEIKAGKIEYRLDKTNIIHCPIGKASFGAEKLQENFNALMSAIVKAKPAAAKGQYLKSVVVASTMGPGIKINAAKIG